MLGVALFRLIFELGVSYFLPSMIPWLGRARKGHPQHSLDGFGAYVH